MFVRSVITGFALCALLRAQRVETSVVAINGRTYTAAAVERLVESLDFYEREMARMNLPEALKFYALRERLAGDAEKAKLADEMPYREELATQRVGILTAAEMNAIKGSQTVKPEDARKYYDEHKDELETLRFKLLFVAFDPNHKPGTRTREEALQRVAEIQKKLAAGASFTDLVKEFSDAQKSRERGGDYATPITRTTIIPGTDQVVPLLFGLLPGKVSEPVQVGNGFDLFKVIDRQPPTFEEARKDVEDRLRTEGQTRAADELEKSVKFEIVNKGFFGAPRKPTDVPAGDFVVAKLNGRDITVDQVGRIANVFPPTAKDSVLANKEEMLRKYGLMELLAERAEKAGYANQSPYRERLATSRVQILAQAQMNAASTARLVRPEDQKAYYDAHRDDFLAVKAVGVYLPYGVDKRSEADAKARAEEFRKKVISGGDADALIKEYSEDPDSRDKGGDLGAISKISNLPADFRNAIFSLKPGEWSQPLRQPNGYYVVRSGGEETAPYEDVKEAIFKIMQQEHFNEYIAKLQSQVSFKVLDSQYFAQRPGGRSL